MSGRTATIGAITVVVALFLVLSGCRLQPDDPADDDAQPDAPNIEATVQSALRSLEERQPSTPTDSADATPLRTPSVGPTATPIVAFAYFAAEPERNGTPTPPSVSPMVPIPTASSSTLPAATITPTSTTVAATVDIPTATPDGADQRPPAPMFAGAFMDGNEHQLADTVGTPTLLMFWAPW